MKLRNLWKRIHSAWQTLHLADKCLLVIMAVLMVQSAHNLFVHELSASDSTSIDVVIRTTMAAIFGYFISANFQNGTCDSPNSGAPSLPFTTFDQSIPTAARPTAKIGFASEGAPSALQSGSARGAPEPIPNEHCPLRILVVAAIGTLSLVLLLIAHNYFAENAASTATISQLRDFVSGSVGFLIGHTSHTTTPN